MTADAQESQVIAAWQRAATELNIEVQAPFHINSNGAPHEFVAFIPDFGGGTVVGCTRAPDFTIDATLVRAAKDGGYHYSFLNISEYVRFDRHSFIETLEEWGFTGPPDRRPTWLKVNSSSP